MLDEEGTGLGKILHVRTEEDRTAMKRRLQQIVPASRDQAPANEGDAPDGVQGRKLTDRVHQDDVFCSASRLGQSASSDHREAAAGDRRLHRGKAIRIAGGQDLQKGRELAPQPDKSLQQRLFLAGVRAARDPDRLLRVDLQLPAPLLRERGHIQLGDRIELEVAHDMNPLGTGAQRKNPLGIGAGLHAEQIDALQDPANEGPDKTVTPKRAA